MSTTSALSGVEGRRTVTRWLLVGALLHTLAACVSNPGEPAKLWTAREFVKSAPAKTDFGGWPADLLVTAEGGAIPFRRPPFKADADLQPSGAGLTVFPAFSAGEVAAFTITDIWYEHPTPWVQPVWAVLNSSGVRPAGVDGRPRIPNIFPVGVDSTFYSPYWRTEGLVLVAADEPDFPDDRITSAKDVLDFGTPLQRGAIVYCPIVPSEVTIAGGATPVHPFTGAPLRVRTHLRAWVDDVEVKYLGFGEGRVSTDTAGELVEAPLYVFVHAAGEPLLPLPAVMPDDAVGSSLVRRTDVVVPANAKIFVPAGNDALRAHVESLGLAAPAPSAQIADDVARAYTLRIATNASCFGDAANFPAGCSWLDSAAKVKALGEGAVAKSDTQLAIATLYAAGSAR